MSAFAILYERSNTTIDPVLFERVMKRLAHRGPDGSDSYLTDHCAMGHWHFWTTPEEVGERQPLKTNDLPFRIVLDGRLDNRSDLLRQLHIPSNENSISDASLILRAYARWGIHCFERFIGEYALVILDEQNEELICARDALGDRTLFHSVHDSRLVVASEPWAVVAGTTGLNFELNENALAHYFAVTIPEDGQTFFKSVYELLPGHVMVANSSGQRTWRYWEPDPTARTRYKSEEEYAEHFLSLLETSVACRLRATTSVGVLMSGGLDSTSVACLAARLSSPNPVPTLSMVFDELTDCDERQYIDAVAEQWGTRTIQIPCDDTWPYRGWQTRSGNPNEPGGNLYHAGLDRVFNRAREEGIRVLLSGGLGDQLYVAGQEWLADLFLEGHFRKAAQGLGLQIQRKGLRKTLSNHAVWLAIRRSLESVFPVARKFHRKPVFSPWLNPELAQRLAVGNNKATLHPAIERHSTLLGLYASYGASHASFFNSRYELEMRSPYRDRRLIEFVISLPAYQLCNGSHYKHVLRESMRNILPEIIRTRNEPTSLLPLYFRGIEKENDSLKNFFQEPNAVWGEYVRADWLLKHWDIHITPDRDGPSVVIPWLCVSYAVWRKSLDLFND